MAWHEAVIYLTAGAYVLAVYNCYKVIGNRMTSGAAIAWILLQLTLPFVGVPLFFLLGDFRIKGYVKRHRRSTRELDAEGGLILPTKPPDEADVASGIRASYASFRRVFSRFGTVFEPQSGKVELLLNGKETFQAIFDAISSAKGYILVQYYILRSDRLGLELKRLLIERAQAGLPVYLLYDDMGSFWLSRDYIRDLRKAGVKVERFLPMASFKRFFQMNFRNHRKLVIVDGAVAFTGGLNVGEEYAARRSKKYLWRTWRDTHVRISGGSVAQLEDTFYEDWYFATEEKLEPLVPDVTPADFLREETPPAIAVTPGVIQIVPTGPTDEAIISVLLILHLCNTAQKRLWIATPYFVPDAAILRGLELAALRGVDVRLMLPRVSDNRLVHWVSLSYAEQAAARGIKVLLYGAGFMHQKVVLVDDIISTVGTMNLDNRALYLNFETVVVIHGQEFNARVADMLEKDFLACRYFAPETDRFLKYFKKLRGNAARLFAPLL